MYCIIDTETRRVCVSGLTLLEAHHLLALYQLERRPCAGDVRPQIGELWHGDTYPEA